MNRYPPVVVLGAGASTGARTNGTRTPPLDSQFLKVAADLFKGRHSRGGAGGVSAWNDFRRDLSSVGLPLEVVVEWRLEQLSTFLEARANLQGLQLSRGKPRAYAQALTDLKMVVAHVLIECGGGLPCELHRMLFELVKAREVVSFNYDLIADQTLAQMGKLAWRSRYYRCSKTGDVFTPNGRRPAYPIGRGRTMDSIWLYKLHGSIHWKAVNTRGKYKLSGCALPTDSTPYLEVRDIPRPPYIIPPVAAKMEIRSEYLKRRWGWALHALQWASAWIIWGYSFPQTDTLAHVLFRTALAKNRRPKPVVLVNPDPTCIGRVKAICGKVRIESFPSVEGYLYNRRSLVRAVDGP